MKTELKEYILEKRQVLGAAALGLLISSGVLFLYQLPLEAVWYSALLVCFAEALWLFTGFGKFRKKQKLLRQLAGEQRKDFSIRDLPESEDPKEEVYQELIESLMKEKGRKDAETAERLRDMEEYYTLWVHQIKTPIAAMSLLLQEEDTPENGELSMELFHIEQYVEMVLQYLRLESPDPDLAIRSVRWTAVYARLYGNMRDPSSGKRSLWTSVRQAWKLSRMKNGWFLCWGSCCPMLLNIQKKVPSGSMVKTASFLSRIRASALLQRICPGSSRRDIRATMAVWTKNPRALVFICARRF